MLDSSELPDKYGSGWYLMQEPHPKVPGHTYEAQADGTWLDITTEEERTDYSDKIASRNKYDILMNLLEGLPVPPAVTFMIIYNELQEYNQHGTVGTLLSAVVQNSGRTGPQVLNYLSPLMSDLSEILGRLVGRRLG